MTRKLIDLPTNLVISEQEIRSKAEADGMTHLSTGIAVIRDGKVLAVRRAADDFLGGSFELPGGGVDAGETLQESVERELLEETGLTVTRILGMFDGFEYATPKKPKVRQLNFLVEAGGEVTLSTEHDSFVWADKMDLGTLHMTGPMKHCFEDALVMA